MIQARKTWKKDTLATLRGWRCWGFTNLNDTLLDIYRAVLLVADPGDTRAAKSANTHSQDTTEERVSGGNGETKAGSESEVGGRSNNGTDHTQHEHLRAVIEGIDGDDLGSDGVCDSPADAEGTGELHHTGTQHGLHVGD